LVRVPVLEAYEGSYFKFRKILNFQRRGRWSMLKAGRQRAKETKRQIKRKKGRIRKNGFKY
jgi:hypothetical protein